MAGSVLFAAAFAVGAAGAPAPSLRGSAQPADGRCCFDGCGDENSCVTGFCSTQEQCLSPQPNGGCDSSPPFGHGAKPSWCPTSVLQSGAAAARGPTVSVQNVGEVEGLDLGPLGHPALAEFRGIPYAKAPTGDLRWRPPEAHPGWVGEAPLDATAYGNICMQSDYAVKLEGFDAETSEDCLYLNIVAPKGALENGAEKLPVMLWIYGGNFEVGFSQERYMANLVSESGNSIIGVSINYRLGVFGFLAGSELVERNGGGGAGNFGIQDQRAAIAWTKANIGAFGGAGNDITLFGQSAGGASVLNHLVQPASFSLFQKAIIESGTYRLDSKPMAEAEVTYEGVLLACDCPDLPCLLETDATALLDGGAAALAASSCPSSFFSCTDWLPVIDGVSLTDVPAALIAAKNYNNKVPVIIGSNRDEVAFFLLGLGNPPPVNMTEAEFDAWEDMFYNEPHSALGPANLAKLKTVYDPEMYPYPADLGGYSQWYWMNVRYTTDEIRSFGACSVRWIARLLAEGGSPAVYSYLFSYYPPFWPQSQTGGAFAAHNLEMIFVFNEFSDHPGFIDISMVPDEAKELARAMGAYWYTFATSKDGDPNPKGAAADEAWPKFTVEGDKVVRLDVKSGGGIRVQQGLRKQACDWQVEQARDLGIPGL